MSKDKKNVPKIRFPGFIDPWEERKLGDEVVFYSGLTYSPSDVIDNGGTLVLRSSNVKDGEIIDADNIYVSSKVVNSDNVQVGDVIVVVRNGSRSLIGKHAQIKRIMKNTVIGAFMTGVRYQQASFLNVLLSTPQFYREIEKNMGATINQITIGTFKEMKFYFPNPIEQKRIGDFFLKLDNLITLHQRKLNNIQNLKAGLLQKMFPKDGQGFPEVRFPGFTEPWEQRKLEEVVDVRNGKDYKHLSEGTIPVYGTGGYMLSVNEALSYDEDAIGIGRKGTIDKPYIIKAPFWTVDTLFYAVPKKNNDLNFMFGIFQRIDWKKKDESTGVPSLSKSSINNTNILITNNEEQKIIGAFFANLDHLITLHHRKLEHLQEQKKSLLQDMFV